MLALKNKKILITGGAGFIGANAAEYFYSQGARVLVLDNLSRAGSDKNLEWLEKNYPSIEFTQTDIRNYTQMLKLMKFNPDMILHLAGQVAVTSSVSNPREDFEINALGSFNVLEAVRETGIKPCLIYASTNKVFGGMEKISIVEHDNRYCYKNHKNGISEEICLDFHSPYGCSKGSADQYFRDYFRIYNIPSIVFRQSCIYGYRQFGVEDQGWVAWFAIASLLDRNITIYGDGKQVRDVLFIDDLLKAYHTAFTKQDICAGNIYNIGGGPEYTMSLLELISFLEKYLAKKISYTFSDWRPGDQKVYISDISKAYRSFGWKPEISPEEGVKRLSSWIEKNQILFV